MVLSILYFEKIKGKWTNENATGKRFRPRFTFDLERKWEERLQILFECQ